MNRIRSCTCRRGARAQAGRARAAGPAGGARRAKTISKEKKTRAVQLATELLAFSEEGIGRPDFIYMDALRHPLRRFIDYFDKDTPREYSTDRLKYILTNLALRLHELGLKKKDVVILVDYGVVIFNFDRSHRQVQRYVSDAFSH